MFCEEGARPLQKQQQLDQQQHHQQQQQDQQQQEQASPACPRPCFGGESLAPPAVQPPLNVEYGWKAAAPADLHAMIA